MRANEINIFIQKTFWKETLLLGLAHLTHLAGSNLNPTRKFVYGFG